ANANRIPAALNQRIDEPSAHSQIREPGESPWNTGVESGVQQIDVERRGKIRRKPSQKKIESVIVRRETEAQTPDFSFSQQVSERGAFGGARAIFGLRSAAGDKIALRSGEEIVFAGIVIEQVEQSKVGEADESGGGKIQAPTRIEKQNTKQRNSDRRRTFRRGIEHGSGKAALVFGKPVADGFGIARKGRSFADSEQEARAE